MTASQPPGPLGTSTNCPIIDEGTSPRAATPPPGPTGTEVWSRLFDLQPRRQESGPLWVTRFPTSTSVDDLQPAFRENVQRFIRAITDAGGFVNIIATFRPAERAYLMHYSSKIARAEIAADEVPAMIGVDIDWVHETPAASQRAASAMVSSFNIVYPPALVSRHTARAAIDMSITGVVGKKIRNSTGEAVEIKALSDLNALGAKYGVYKLESDPPHWSDNGH